MFSFSSACLVRKGLSYLDAQGGVSGREFLLSDNDAVRGSGRRPSQMMLGTRCPRKVSKPTCSMKKCQPPPARLSSSVVCPRGLEEWACSPQSLAKKHSTMHPSSAPPPACPTMEGGGIRRPHLAGLTAWKQASLRVCRRGPMSREGHHESTSPEPIPSLGGCGPPSAFDVANESCQEMPVDRVRLLLGRGDPVGGLLPTRLFKR